MNLEDAIQKIIINPLFLRLKNVVENNSYHDHEDVYSHLIKTKDIAIKKIAGDFINNDDAKKLFLEFINQEYHGMKKGDIMVLTALLHDIGKILYIKEGNKSKSIQTYIDNINNLCPGHEHEGSKIVSKFVEELNLSKEVIEYISWIIRFHDTFNQYYLDSKKNWPIEILIQDMQSRANGYYIESAFNAYCDFYYAIPFQSIMPLLKKVFCEKDFYKKGEYFIPEN